MEKLSVGRCSRTEEERKGIPRWEMRNGVGVGEMNGEWRISVVERSEVSSRLGKWEDMKMNFRK